MAQVCLVCCFAPYLSRVKHCQHNPPPPLDAAVWDGLLQPLPMQTRSRSHLSLRIRSMNDANNGCKVLRLTPGNTLCQNILTCSRC